MAFFPFAEPADVIAGTSVHVRFSAHPFEDDYVWKWGASATDRRGDAWTADQSSVRGIPIDPAVLGRRKPSHRVERSASLEADRLILRLFGEGATLGEVAAALVDTHPDVTPTTQAALSRAADLGERYG